MEKRKYVATAVNKLLKDQHMLLILRILLGGIFIVSAIMKIPNPDEFVRVVMSYGILPYGLAELYGIFLPWAELIIGILLITGLLTRIASAIALLLTISFFIANIQTTAVKM